MSQRFKSSLYFAGFVIASLIYYNETNPDHTPQTVDIASSSVEQVSSLEGLD
ncbi:MAG: hypothetical protein HKN31_04495 [Pricia sp.]|nr:hypothetical protein [Pricia sp.]